MLAVAHPPLHGRLPLPISLRSLSPILAATFMPRLAVFSPLVVLSPAASSSDPSLSSASFCDAAAACRALALAASLAFKILFPEGVAGGDGMMGVVF